MQLSDWGGGGGVQWEERGGKEVVLQRAKKVGI